MGLIKAATGALGGVLADQWKEYFYCDSIDSDILVVKGQKRTSGRSSNKRGEDNVISNGSGIIVADGQCMIIVEQGKVVELCAEPGVFRYDNEISPSIFAGNLKEGIKESAKEIINRFKFGGFAGKDQRVYYFNTKEIVGNKYGTATPIPFRVVDKNIGFDADLSLRCNGEYSYRIVDPIAFFTNLCGNISDKYERAEIDSQLKSEILNALQPVLAKLGENGVRYSAIPAYADDMAEELNNVLSQKWGDFRGIKVVSFNVNSATVTEEDEAALKKLQQAAALKDPRLAMGALVGAQADAMRTAASNESGSMMGFMGLGMANQAGGGVSVQDLLSAANEQPAQMQQPQNVSVNDPDEWKCACGYKTTGKFCPECGAKRPTDPIGWTCSCGARNKGKFCTECGSKKPQGARLYKCDKCGWEPDDPAKPPKFCPECGDVFDEGDVL